MHLALVRSAQAGDRDAFAQLAAASISSLHRTARLILRDEERAGDVVQDSLLTAWLDIRALRDPERFDAWLLRILIHACYREARHHRRRQAIEVRVDALEALGEPGDHAGIDARDVVDRGFRRLTTDQRAALVLHHYLGLRDAEAANALGIPAGTFKSRLSRAGLALRAAIEADEREFGRAAESVA